MFTDITKLNTQELLILAHEGLRRMEREEQARQRVAQSELAFKRHQLFEAQSELHKKGYVVKVSIEKGRLSDFVSIWFKNHMIEEKDYFTFRGDNMIQDAINFAKGMEVK